VYSTFVEKENFSAVKNSKKLYKLIRISLEVNQFSLNFRRRISGFWKITIITNIIMWRQKSHQLVLLVAAVHLLLVGNVHGIDNVDCANSENPNACRSANLLTKVFNQVTSNNGADTLKLLPGVEIVENENINKLSSSGSSSTNDERSMPEKSNETIFTRIAKYLKTHDLKIKFADIVGKTDLQEVVNNVFNTDDPAVNGELFSLIANVSFKLLNFASWLYYERWKMLMKDVENETELSFLHLQRHVRRTREAAT